MSVAAGCKESSLFLQPCCSTFIFNQHFWKLAEGNGEEIGGRNIFCLFSEFTLSGYSRRQKSVLDLCPVLFLAVAV